MFLKRCYDDLDGFFRGGVAGRACLIAQGVEEIVVRCFDGRERFARHRDRTRVDPNARYAGFYLRPFSWEFVRLAVSGFLRGRIFLAGYLGIPAFVVGETGAVLLRCFYIEFVYVLTVCVVQVDVSMGSGAQGHDEVG